MGSELRVQPGSSGHRYDVTLGRAVLKTADGRRRDLAQGETIAPDSAQPSAAAASVIAEPSPADAAIAPSATGDERAAGDLELGAGASAVVYDPTPPSRIQFRSPERCTLGAMLSLGGDASQFALAPAQVLSLPAGTHEYRIACKDAAGKLASPQWHGMLRIVRNPGTAPLPRTAPRNAIDADGRTYTVLFQNLLPVLEVRWPAAPSGRAYTLSVQLESGRTLALELQRPDHVFAAGTLPEGRHQLRFAAGQVQSRPTTIDLRFDNASPMASLRAPAVTGFEPGARVHVAGLALPGADVSLLGQHLPLDAQQRFAGDVTLPAGTQAIAVRIHHPRSGTRYYVRRVRASP
jgi:hypothetical protein